VSTTGIAGLTLGGGEGWLMGRYGLTVDHLTAVELVTANGEVLTASAEEHEDLFWALRGGGGNFGVVTAFEYRAHPVSVVTAGTVAHPLCVGQAAFDLYREVTAATPDSLTTFFVLAHGPDGLDQKLVLMPLCHCGDDPGRIERDLAPIRNFRTALIDDVQAMPYPQANTLIDNGYPRGALNYWKSAFLHELSDEAFTVMADYFQRCPSPMSGILLVHYHGAATQVDPAATAFPHRHPGYSLVVAAQWLDPADTDLNIGWARETFAALRPYLAERCYVNNLSADDGDAVRNAYGPNYQRLRAIKRRYDPDNIFHLNHNIAP
jgi:hypothetical protein